MERNKEIGEDMNNLPAICNRLTDISFIPDGHWTYLANLAMPENWEYKKDFSPYPYPILRNYIYFTFQRLADLYNKSPSDTYIIKTENEILFNTGLLTKHYEQIYMLLKKNIQGFDQEWISDGFYEESNYKILHYRFLPKRASYISSIEDLIFDTSLRLVPNFAHILEDEENVARLPDELRKDKNLASTLNAEIFRVKKRIDANYKVAVPQFYQGKMQFLLPISLSGDPQNADLVLAVNKINSFCYRGNTMLTIDMAYNNARLIAKPETDWLVR